MCILVVEDEPIVRMCAVACLEDVGYAVMDAAHGLDAIELIGRWTGHFTALVTDYNLPPPAFTGADVIAQMRQTYPRIPMIITTAARNPVSDDFLAAQRVHLLRKPYDADALTGLLAGLLDAA